MQNKNDKKIVIITIIIVLALLVIRMFLSPLVAGDEFINYYNNVKIYSGEKMWEEVNIITTPFIYLIGCLFFKLFGIKFVVYKIYNLVINILFFAILYKTFKNLNINKLSCLIYTIILEIPIISYVTLWGVTYNIVSVLFCIIGINLNLKKKEIKHYNLSQGIIIFLVLFTKQNIGIYYLFSQIIIELIIEKKWNKIINLSKQFFIVIIGIIIFIMILYKNNLLSSFVDLTLMGINTFISNIEISKIPFFITVGILVLLGILIYLKKYDINNKNNIIILSITGVMMLFISFPIADTWHIILSSMILYIEIIYLLDFNEIKLNNSKILVYIDLYLIFFIILNICYSAFFIVNKKVELDLNPESIFYLTFIKNYKSINKVEEFIKSKDGKVLIISPESGIYNLKLNLKSKQILDLPFNGNLGKNQFDKIVKKLKDYDDYYILIHTTKKYIQEIDDIRIYIDKNYNKICEIEGFSVYK